ncbi:sn-glycerol-3-phosphate ABC transporter ATP-binding protein UgpC [Rahnella perminowiae]|uniref:ABC transporter ATP-binding protein n=1 Tax=Rahnella perminowiae TaxID=2816244 RepID=UPI00224A76FA|nr:sn-glycerol-3-phosphate ABC transporter ATP-binding protein UgpC [Rahnella perminowiae]MCX2944548.1 sn-glycerol-3-phosphate ABC transporter ATP-binding protein UgpC [Rahnella perminowiae]
MANLQLKAIKKSYENVNVIHGIDLEINDGEFVVFVGPSGCGKSTLLRMIAGLEEITQGSLWVDGVDMTQQPATERGIAMVFQSYALYPNMTVRGNLSYPLEVAKRPKAEIKRLVGLTAQKLHLNELLDRMPRALSGGQRQRVAIGRAIIREPRIFLFDEPLSNLDAELRLQMRIEIAKLHESLGNTMIYVTHDQLEAMTLADRIVVLRQGVIEQVGSPLGLYHDPDNMFVAGFIGSPRINFMAAEVVAATGGHVQLRIAALGVESLIVPLLHPPGEGGKVWLGVRPEHFVSPDSADCQFSATLTFAERLGHTNYLYLDYADEKTLVVEQRQLELCANGDTVRFGINAKECLLFAQSGERIR